MAPLLRRRELHGRRPRPPGYEHCAHAAHHVAADFQHPIARGQLLLPRPIAGARVGLLHRHTVQLRRLNDALQGADAAAHEGTQEQMLEL
jgi:hypothetical protein